MRNEKWTFGRFAPLGQRMRNEKWITAFLLLLLTISAAAQDVIIQRGCRVGTPRPEGMALRRGAPSGQPKQVGGDFYKGDLHQLVVMVAFADKDFQQDETATLELWNDIFNTEGYTDGSFQGSVHDYFCAQSYNQFRPVFDLVYVKVSGNAKKYASDALTDENSQYLVQDIMEQLVQNPTIDWSLYDWNGDGFINQLLIIYAGKGQNAGGGSDTIWPHQWWMSEHMKDHQQGVYCDPIPVTYGENQYFVDSYCCVQEVVNTSNVKTSFGTICHEYSHCFGFPDFYRGSIKYVYEWELMDAGNYNGKGFCPASYSAHERWLMGWLTPTELDYDRTITNMPSLTEEGVAYLIRNEGYEDEYYMIENRQQDGWDIALPGSGLIIFHIDFDPSIWTSVSDTPNSSKIQRYTIFNANNSTSLIANWPYPYLANDSLTNRSKPAATLNNENTDGTKLMNKSVHDINVFNGRASFRFTIDQSTGIDELQAEGEPRELYRIGPVIILRYPNGVVRKVVRAKP